MSDSFLTVEETASLLSITPRHVRRLMETDVVVRVARGLVDRDSVDRYLHSRRQGRTRAWAESTAWGAVALLSGRDAHWLGATQASRLRGALRNTTADDLLARMRDRAQVHVFLAHPAALPRLRESLISPNLRLLGIADAVDDRLDGYLAEAELDRTVRELGLRAHSGGTVVLRTSSFDFTLVRDLVTTTAAAALDAATSLDPRLRGAGRSALQELLEAYA